MTSVRVKSPRFPSQVPRRTGEVVEASDRQLLDRFATGGVAAGLAFDALVRRHGPMVLGVCRQLLRDPHEAEDAFQVTFLVLARKAGSIRRPELLGHWLYGVAVRTARKAKALAMQRPRRLGEDLTMVQVRSIVGGGRHELQVDRREEAEALHEEVGRLPEKYRVPIVLCYLEGLSHVEAAERLRWPVGTLSVRLMRARGLLRARLTRRGLAPTACLLAVEWLSGTADAAVPFELAEATVRIAPRFAVGQASTTGFASASVAALSETVLASLFAEKLAAATVLMIAIAGFVVAGAGAIASSMGEHRGPDGPSGAREGPRLFAVRQAPTPPKAPQWAPNVWRGAVDPESSQVDRGVGVSAVPDHSPAVPPPSTAAVATEDLSTYRLLAAGVGRDADAQVRLALWCEAHGLNPERIKHLALAILNDPSHATARGLLGQVAYRGRWLRPYAIAEGVRADTDLTTALAEYDARRRRAADTVEAQWKLALWCERGGLKAESTTHLRAVTRLDPGHEAAWKRLGCRRYNGRWLTEEQVASEREEADARKEGDRRWRPLLAKWRGWLVDRDRRDEAERLLAGVADPYAVSSVWAVFGDGTPADQARAVQILGQIDAPAADRPLAILAVASPSEDIRRTACETLSRRDPRDAIGLIVGLLRDPDPHPSTPLYRFQWLPAGALGLGSPGVTLAESRYARALRLYTLDESRRTPLLLGTPALPDASYAWRVELSRRRQWGELPTILGSLRREVLGELEASRTPIRSVNARMIQALRNITGQDRGEGWEDWTRWWVEELGYAYDPDRYRNPPDLTFDRPKPTSVSQAHTSCFGAGTPVRTLTGPRPIESIRPGDQVLTQDVRSGALSFAPVMTVSHNRPAPTLRIDLGDEPIVATEIHRFWKVGRGWVMARDLKPGDAVRTVDGPSRVLAISADRVQAVFNLEVASGRSFFAGGPAALVHDNSAVQPVLHPFDEVPDLLASLKGGGAG